MHNIPHTKETKIKISQRRLQRRERLGYINSPETRVKMRRKHRKIKDTSKMNKDKIGKKRPPFSKEWRKQISDSLLGRTGENSRNWQGGKTSLQRIVRGCFKYRQWRSDVFTRDDFTCQECGVRGAYLEAHHIKTFSKIIKDNKIKTIEQALCCEELWNINNGTTLCKDCHKQIIKL